MSDKLFAVYLGGCAPRSNTELHDVVFVVGPSIDATYEQLMDNWFGTPEGLHLDSWLELDIVEGHRVTLSREKPQGVKRLFFINLGAYKDGVFGEAHDTGFFVAADAREAKTKAKAALFQNWPQKAHTDDIHNIDDCIELKTVDSFFVVLEQTDEVTASRPMNGYHIIPKDVVAEYMQRHAIAPLSLTSSAYE